MPWEGKLGHIEQMAESVCQLRLDALRQGDIPQTESGKRAMKTHRSIANEGSIVIGLDQTVWHNRVKNCSRRTDFVKIARGRRKKSSWREVTLRERSHEAAIGRSYGSLGPFNREEKSA
jgi:hypothetical protein